MRCLRVLMWPVLAVLLAPVVASAAPGDPYVIYTANNYADGAVILRTDPGAGSLVEISRNGPQGRLFAAPYDLAVEADGSLLVADMGTLCTPVQPRCAEDGRIIRVDPITGRQSLLVGGAPLVDPAGLALAPNGDIYVADNYEADGDGAVFRINRSSGAITSIAEGGLLDLPFDLVLDADGSLVVSNRVQPGACVPLLAGRLVRVQPGNGAQSLVSEGGLFSYPLGVALDSTGAIVFANECGSPGLARVLSDTTQGLLTTNNALDVLVTPERLVLDPAGDFLVSDWSLADGDGGIVRVDSETGSQGLVRKGDLFNHPMGIAAVVSRPPNAALRAPPLVAAGDRVTLDASASNDPEGLRLAYEWDLDGNGVYELGTRHVPTATRTPTRQGAFTVRVRVNDPHGGRAVAQGVVRVDGSTPRITRLRSGSGVLGVGRPRRRAKRLRDSRKLPPRSTKIRFKLSEAAEVKMTIGRTGPGRRNPQPRVLNRNGKAGANSFQLAARGLRPGRYRLFVEATDAVGHAATKRRLGLRVVSLASR